MKRYSDYRDIPSTVWTNYKIVVPTEEDRKELMEAFEHFHYADIDTENIAVNQLAHEYRDNLDDESTWNNIIVDPALYETLSNRKGKSE